MLPCSDRRSHCDQEVPRAGLSNINNCISEEAVRQTLSLVGKSAPGSIIVFTYVLKSVIERRSDITDANKVMDTVAKDAPWVFGLEPSSIQAYLQPFHLALIEDAGNANYQEKYLKPLGRSLVVFEGERIVQASVTGLLGQEWRPNKSLEDERSFDPRARIRLRRPVHS
ncbi:MAG TPA: hypothetical protein VE398_02130 [Acidobacteriota bacterium]|nr:hypothetical protein [Acidobacteriota bacterium]